MLRIRIIPCLLLRNESLVKTVKFGKFGYIGDPANTCRIFNELEVDELAFLDINANKERCEPNYNVLADIANECFMPVSYGGGISSVAIAERILKLGFEKIVLNTYSLTNPSLITEISTAFGSQSLIVSIDVKTNFWGKQHCRGRSGTENSKRHPVDWAKEVQQRGAGEILLTSIDNEGTWSGFDIELTRQVTDAVSIPVIANGGAGSLQHIGEAVKIGHASAVALGSMVVYQKQGMGVLVNFPDEKKLKAVID
ncbi:MAG: imidazole glycerol-phosphate synthase subunit HisF [Desulfobacteraceae bacterium Eth-SRB2]|nr:MAG: imidazole glycerol-phosphate synthase subunit HisF [Desulfobacteraceae bacterium Eth-SRB2]